MRKRRGGKRREWEEIVIWKFFGIRFYHRTWRNLRKREEERDNSDLDKCNHHHPGVEIETNCHPWDFSPILNVIVTQLSPGITGWLRGIKWESHPVVTRHGYRTGIYWVTFLFVTPKSPSITGITGRLRGNKWGSPGDNWVTMTFKMGEKSHG